MSADAIPSAWTQHLPRAVRLGPAGLIVPAPTLRVLLAGGPASLVNAGYAFEPAIAHEEEFVVRADRQPRPGDLALCDIEGWGDIRRLLRRHGPEDWVAAVDSLPRPREIIRASAVLGVITGVGQTRRAPRRIDRLFPLWSRIAAAVSWARRLRQAPRFGHQASQSVRSKYAQQVEQYSEQLRDDIAGPLDRLVVARLPAGATVLVAGSGAGGECIALARRGFRVTGFDFVPSMIEASRRNAAARDVTVEFFGAEIADLDLGGRRFAAAYVTPLVYSFIPSRARRIASLRALGRHLTPDGIVVFSAALIARPLQWIELAALWLLRMPAGERNHEFGDWYTSFLTPSGTIGTSYLHRGSRARVLGEARAAGFSNVRWMETGYFVAGRFRG